MFQLLVCYLFILFNILLIVLNSTSIECIKTKEFSILSEYKLHITAYTSNIPPLNSNLTFFLKGGYITPLNLKYNVSFSVQVVTSHQNHRGGFSQQH